MRTVKMPRTSGKVVRLGRAFWEFARDRMEAGDTLPVLMRRLLRLPPPPPPDDRFSRNERGRWCRGVGRWPSPLYIPSEPESRSAAVPRDIYTFVSLRSRPDEPFYLTFLRLAGRRHRGVPADPCFRGCQGTKSSRPVRIA